MVPSVFLFNQAKSKSKDLTKNAEEWPQDPHCWLVSGQSRSPINRDTSPVHRIQLSRKPHSRLNRNVQQDRAKHLSNEQTSNSSKRYKSPSNCKQTAITKKTAKVDAYKTINTRRAASKQLGQRINDTCSAQLKDSAEAILNCSSIEADRTILTSGGSVEHLHYKLGYNEGDNEDNSSRPIAQSCTNLLPNAQPKKNNRAITPQQYRNISHEILESPTSQVVNQSHREGSEKTAFQFLSDSKENFAAIKNIYQKIASAKKKQGSLRKSGGSKLNSDRKAPDMENATEIEVTDVCFRLSLDKLDELPRTKTTHELPRQQRLRRNCTNERSLQQKLLSKTAKGNNISSIMNERNMLSVDYTQRTAAADSDAVSNTNRSEYKDGRNRKEKSKISEIIKNIYRQNPSSKANKV